MSGDKQCDRCGEFIEWGRTYYEVCEHTGSLSLHHPQSVRSVRVETGELDRHGQAARAMRLARCKQHGIQLVAYCPACRGSQGGKSTSSAKAAAARRNATKARKVRAEP